MRKPSIHALLDIENRPAGLTEVILGHTSFEEAKNDRLHENLSVLIAGGSPPKPTDLLSSQQFKDFIEQRRQEYSLIIVDAPPMLGLADSAEVAKVVDATLFIVEANRTTAAQARAAVNRLRGVGARITGGILTKYNPLEAGTEYGYDYYSYKYGSSEEK